MIRNEEKYQKATYFRKRGFSYTEIAKLVGVSRGTLSNWFAKKSFSKKVKVDNEIKTRKENVKRISLLNKARQTEKNKKHKEVLKSANTEYKNYRHLPHFMAGIALYVAVGDLGNNNNIRLSDSRIDIHKIFIRFLVDFLGMDKKDIKCWLAIDSKEKESKEVAVWSKLLKISSENFYKSQVISNINQSTLRKTIGNTIIVNATLKQKLNRWVELASKELVK